MTATGTDYMVGAQNERAGDTQGVEVRKGDCVIVRTGMLVARCGRWGDYTGGPTPGLSLHTVPWLYEHDVAAIATDTWRAEVRPNEVPNEVELAVK